MTSGKHSERTPQEKAYVTLREWGIKRITYKRSPDFDAIESGAEREAYDLLLKSDVWGAYWINRAAGGFEALTYLAIAGGVKEAS